MSLRNIFHENRCAKVQGLFGYEATASFFSFFGACIALILGFFVEIFGCECSICSGNVFKKRDDLLAKADFSALRVILSLSFSLKPSKTTPIKMLYW